jgi:4'-phosphopantetheinyl transferase
MSDEQELMRHITLTASEIFRRMGPDLPAEWLSSDITLAQLRVLLILHMNGPCRMSVIARELNVTLSTATGILDKLVKKGYVSRCSDAEDRRVVTIQLSETGTELTGKLWSMGRFKMEKLLEKLDKSELQQASKIADALLSRAMDIKD